jgi:hypothetical protein
MENLFLSRDGAFSELRNEDFSSPCKSSITQMEDEPKDTPLAVVGVEIP